MADAVDNTTLPDGPNRRGFIFWASAIFAGWAIAPKAAPPGDPVDAAIEAFRQASIDLQNCFDEESPEWGRLVDRRHERQVALARTTPATRDGAHKLMSELVLDELGGDGLQGDSPLIIAIGTVLHALPHLA